jgi:Ca2+-transporting ATPase
VLTAYGYGLLRYGAGARASGLAFNTLVIAQLLHAYLCRSRYHGLFGDGKTERNRMLDAAIGGSIGLQAMANLIPGLRRLLGLGATGLLDLGVMLAAAGIPLLINDATKQRSFDGPKSPSSVYHSTFKQSV